MSWNGNAENEMNIEAVGCLQLGFDCPCCNNHQVVNIDINDINNTYDFTCQACGNDKLRGYINISASASYKS